MENVQKYYPDGVNGIGDAWNEAAGMLRYLQDRYGTPESADAKYNKMGFEGY